MENTVRHAVSTSPFKKGDDVLILGGGPIGLAVTLVLKSKGCENIMVAEASCDPFRYAMLYV